MRIRETTYLDYGFMPGEEKQLQEFCRSPDFSENFILSECAKQSNPCICKELEDSIVRGLSWDKMDARKIQIYSKADFYGYRRLTLGLFRNILILSGRYPIKI